MTPLDFFKITLKRLPLRHRNFVSFSTYLIDTFKKIPVNDITTSYDDVISKNGGANFTAVKSKINDLLVKSHLNKI